MHSNSARSDTIGLTARHEDLIRISNSAPVFQQFDHYTAQQAADSLHPEFPLRLLMFKFVYGRAARE